MCSTNYLGINLMKAIEPDAIVSDLPLECQAILFPSDRRYLVEEFKLEVVWPESDKEGKGLVSKMFPNLKRTVSDIKEEIIERVIEGINDGKKSKCDKESPEERNLLSDSLDLNEEASYDDILGALDVKVEGMQEMNRRIESKMETTLEAVDEKLNKMETKLEEKIETKFKTLEEKMETLEKKIERKFEVTDRKMDEMKNMIAQLLEQMAKQSVTETEEQ
jgi:flagellar capping protein FliD